jgi:hypothetical protein
MCELLACVWLFSGNGQNMGCEVQIPLIYFLTLYFEGAKQFIR